MRRALLWIGVVAASACTGWLARGVVGRAPAAVAAPAPSSSDGDGAGGRAPRFVTVNAGTPARCGITVDEMRALLAEHAAGTLAPSPTSAPPPRREPSPEALDAVARVEAAALDGAWSAEDRELLRRSMGELDRAQFDAILSKLTMAVNAGRLKPDGPLF